MKVCLLLVCFAFVGTRAETGYYDSWSSTPTPTGYRGMSLTFQDEANGESLKFKESSSSSTEENIEEVGLRLHNKFRQKHGVPSLILDAELSRKAQKWADHLAQIDQLIHSGGSVGENIWSGFGIQDPMSSAVNGWYSEHTLYDYSAGKCITVPECPQLPPGQKVLSTQLSVESCCWHFTQVVWKNSKRLGLGQAKARSGNEYIVAQYLPAGNYLGQFKENVPRPISEKVSSEKLSVKKLVSAGLDLLRAGTELKLNVDIKNPEALLRAI